MTVRIVSLESIPVSLVHRFADGEGLLWTGAGVSRRPAEDQAVAKRPVGVPTAAALQRHFTKWTRPPHPVGGDLADLANVYRLQHGRPRLNRLIAKIFSASHAAAPPFYDLISALPAAVRVFVTTNYDPFLERSLSFRNPTVVVRDIGLECVGPLRPVIYKPHGDARLPESCVITTADYDDWEDTQANLRAQLAALFLQHTVVAIGYRAQDDNFRRLLRSVNAGIIRTGGKPHALYVVIPAPEVNDFAAYAGPEYDIVLISATGEAFVDWLIRSLFAHRQAQEARLLTNLIEPPPIAAARQKVFDTTALLGAHPSEPVKGSEPLWRSNAEALLVLADAETSAGRAIEALHSLAHAVVAYRLANVNQEADHIYRRVVSEALVERRDPLLAERLRRIMGTRPVGVATLPEPSDPQTQYVLALCDILSGIPDELPRIAQAKDDSGISCTDDSPRLDGYHRTRLQAEHLVTRLDFLGAARGFFQAAECAPDAATAAECQVRGHLFRAMSEPATRGDAADELASISDHLQPGMRALCHRAIGWIAALRGDLDRSANAFREAARFAISTVDPVQAATSYRAAAWVDRQRPGVSAAFETPESAADRLEERSPVAQSAPRRMVGSLLKDADVALLRGALREAWLSASAALRLAYDDIDAPGVERASRSLADILLATLAKQPDDEFALIWATHFAGASRASVKDADAASWANALHVALRDHSSPAQRARAIAQLAHNMVGRHERTGGLLLLADLAPIIDQQHLHAEIVPLIASALTADWHISYGVDLPRAACVLLERVYENLLAEDATIIREVITNRLNVVPAFRLETAYLALAQTTSRSPIDEAEGADLARLLVAALDSARALPSAPSHIAALSVAIAALVTRTNAPTRDALMERLVLEAEAGRWEGVAVLAATGGPVPPALPERYLDNIVARIRALTVRASQKAIGFTMGDDPRLTEYAASNAALESRERAVDAALQLLKEDGQWSVNRAAWVGFVTALLIHTPSRMESGLASLLKLAEGQFADPGAPPFGMSSHPLSAFRFHLGDGSNLQAQSVAALGQLYHAASRVDQLRIQAAFNHAFDDANSAVRRAAVIGVVASSYGAPSAGESHLQLNQWQQAMLIGALADPVDRVRDRALRALVDAACSKAGAA